MWTAERRIAALDIGGTAVKSAVWQNERLDSVRETPMPVSSAGDLMDAAAEIIRKMGPVDAVGISTRGQVDGSGVILFDNGPVTDYTGTPVRALLEQALGVPVVVENDVNCAGLAESISGVGKDSRMNVCLTVGTGIGGCLIVDKKVFHGFSNSACEVGYLRLPQGEFQREASATALCERVSKRKQGRKPIGERWDGVRIFQAAQDGDRICTEEIDRLIDILALGIANICYVANPKTVILGGGIMEQELYIQPRLEKALMKYLIPQVWKNTKICMAEYKNDAGMLGAFYHFRAMQKKRK